MYIDTPGRLNCTPLFFATLFGFEEVVRILLSRGSSAMDLQQVRAEVEEPIYQSPETI